MSDTVFTSEIKVGSTLLGIAGLVALSNLPSTQVVELPGVLFESPAYTLVESTTSSSQYFSDESSINAIVDFAKSVIENQKGMDAEIAQHIENNFFDLI